MEVLAIGGYPHGCRNFRGRSPQTSDRKNNVFDTLQVFGAEKPGILAVSDPERAVTSHPSRKPFGGVELLVHGLGGCRRCHPDSQVLSRSIPALHSA